MKTIKILAAVLGLFLMGNVNALLAQETERNDSIYGLEVSIVDNIMDLSFYSTYDKNDLQEIYINFYNKNTEEHLGDEIKIWSFGLDSFMFAPRYVNGKAYILNEEEDIYRMDINNVNLINNIFMLDDNINELKMELYIVQTSSIRSNVLTFSFNSTITALPKTMESNNNENNNNEFKYFLLSGIEILKKPIGISFIEISYENGKKMAVNKWLIK